LFDYDVIRGSHFFLSEIVRNGLFVTLSFS
ncbi:uncharacterized protein METZ01_LOCUS239333, partial [marine metagenome]